MTLVRDALALAVFSGLLMLAAACACGWIAERRASTENESSDRSADR